MKGRGDGSSTNGINTMALNFSQATSEISIAGV